MRGRQGVKVADNPLVTVDYLEAGSFGPVVVLVHSSVSGARQWRRLMDDLNRHSPDDSLIAAVTAPIARH
ncbi:MAG TPA: hypothetical protein VFE60_28595 [Roseiarcus sp.]|nr:hypothetical protein [Roseiarcus sp.]